MESHRWAPRSSRRCLPCNRSFEGADGRQRDQQRGGWHPRVGSRHVAGGAGWGTRRPRPDVAALFADRRNRVALFKADGSGRSAPQLSACRRACSAWADLELSNAEAWRCLGEAQQAQGNHQEAVNAFRKAKQNDPTDRSLDAAIERSQKGIVGDFLHRYKK
jgi:hypothetical protein